MLKNHKGIIALFFLSIIVLFLTVNSFADEIKLTTLLSNALWEKSDSANSESISAPGTMAPKTGNVGIGVIAPTEKLDVNGNINALGYKVNSTDIGQDVDNLEVLTSITVAGGVTGPAYVSGGTKKVLTFRKGILVSATDSTF